MNNILNIKNISKTYYTDKKEIEAIKNITLDIKENDMIAIVGPSGCGKSTLLSILNKQLEPTNGLINYNNKTIGYMLQEDALFDWLNILENCLIGLKVNNTITKEKKEYVLQLLYKYGLKDFIYSYPRNLSGGMRQRVALIRTLALNPDILIMDEPFSALDYQTRINISTDVYNIIKKENKTLLLVTHNVNEALYLCNKIIVLSNRPSTIKNIYEIEYGDIDIKERSNTDIFKYYYKKIMEDIYE